MVCICGIPEITLKGTVEDWKLLREKALSLGRYELEWWTEELMKAGFGSVCSRCLRGSRQTVLVLHLQAETGLRPFLHQWMGCYILPILASRPGWQNEAKHVHEPVEER